MNKLWLVILLGVVLVGGIWYTTPVSAVGMGQGFARHQNLVSRLVQRFGLNQTEVESFFGQVHQEHMTQRLDDLSDRLDQAVAQGTLSPAQQQLILEKVKTEQQEKAANWENWSAQTPQERRAAMQQHRQEMRDWFDTNGIDHSLLSPVGGNGFFKGMGGMGRN